MVLSLMLYSTIGTLLLQTTEKSEELYYLGKGRNQCLQPRGMAVKTDSPRRTKNKYWRPGLHTESKFGVEQSRSGKVINEVTGQSDSKCLDLGIDFCKCVGRRN